MSFLLDTDICSAYLKNDRKVVGKVMLHFGGLSVSVSVATVGELLVWGLRSNARAGRMQGINDLLMAAYVIDIDFAIVNKYGEIRAALLDQGQDRGAMDLLNAATALVHNMTMVTHNVADYAIIPALTIEDWLA